MIRRKIIAGNWKMNGSAAANAALLEAVQAGSGRSQAVDVVIFPPFPYLHQAAGYCSGGGLQLGAQNVSQFLDGAYTGEVSARMLCDLGCRYVLVGHSERRALFGDTDAVVAEKFGGALDAGLIPVLCIGETLGEREAGDTLSVVRRQLNAVLDHCGPSGFSTAVVAYEPVWAIGTGRTATPDQVQEVHAAIREHMAVVNAGLASGLRILYGGSVKAENASVLLALPDVDGALVGGASLKAADFLPIINSIA